MHGGAASRYNELTVPVALGLERENAFSGEVRAGQLAGE